MKKSMEDLLLDAIDGKYFQHKLNAYNIIKFSKSNIPNFSPINGTSNTLSVWSPRYQKNVDLSLKKFDHYIEISKNEYEKY